MFHHFFIKLKIFFRVKLVFPQNLSLKFRCAVGVMAASLTQSKIVDSNKEIGDLLLQVQNDLKSLRTQIARDGSNVDVKLLQTNLKKAEEEIKV